MSRTWLVWLALCFVVGTLYSPAEHAGFVADFTGWLQQMQHFGFWDNINRTHYRSNSLFQFTQLVTWLLFQVFGTRAILWHGLHVLLHAANGALLFSFCNRLYRQLGLRHPNYMAMMGACLFCVAINASEVVVWESAYHFAQGLLFILLILNWCQQYLAGGSNKLLLYAVIAYFLSSFTLEIFYITPVLVLILAGFYHLTGINQARREGTLTLRAAVPMLGILVLHFALVKLTYGTWMPHLAGNAVATAPEAGFGKPAKVLYNILLFGRFATDDTRQHMYHVLDSAKGIAAFYGAMVVLLGFLALRIKKASGITKAVALLFSLFAATLVFLIPLWFEPMFLVVFDRYTYFTGAFLYALIPLLFGYLPYWPLQLTFFGIYAFFHARTSFELARYWMRSEKVISGLLHSVPPANGRITILLNVPQNMQGIPMIGAEQQSEFQLMHDELYPTQKLIGKVYDGLAYNMLTPYDGAKAEFTNDSTVRVTLNQWGTWWWYAMRGATGYSTPDYRIDLVDPGHCYDLILKHPRQQYLLLCQDGLTWYEVKK